MRWNRIVARDKSALVVTYLGRLEIGALR